MTTEICKHCNGWRGLHKWDTMQCPYMGYENEMWQETTYEEADETAAVTIAAQAARIAELEAQVKELEAALKAYETEHADNAHDEGVDAGMSFPPENCDCDNCRRARALLETK